MILDDINLNDFLLAFVVFLLVMVGGIFLLSTINNPDFLDNVCEKEYKGRPIFYECQELKTGF